MIPALVFAGDEDPSHAVARQVADSMPNAKFVSLPGLTHFTAICQSPTLLPQITGFLEGVLAPTHQ